MILAWLAFAVAIALLVLMAWLAERWELLDDRPRVDTPGARNDRMRLLDEGRAG